jgi:hypothetical protein
MLGTPSDSGGSGGMDSGVGDELDHLSNQNERIIELLTDIRNALQQGQRR